MAPRLANNGPPDTMSAVTAFAPLLTRTPHVWIRGKLWHATRLSCRVPVEVLVDTGAGGGNYASLVFMKTVQTNLWGGKAIISSAGKGFLRAANPKGSAIPPMEVIGSGVKPVVFPPIDRVFRISSRVVRDLPYAVVLGAAFMKGHHSTISFRDKEGFPTPESTWVPFSSHTANSATSSKNITAAWTSFCAVRPPADDGPDPDNPQRIPKYFAEASEDSLDQVVDYLHITCWKTKERRRSRAATVNAKRNTLRKLERRRQQAATETATAGTETVPTLVSQPPSDRQPGKEPPNPNQTETDSSTAADEAV